MSNRIRSRKKKQNLKKIKRQLGERKKTATRAVAGNTIQRNEEYDVNVRAFPIMVGVPMDEVMFSKFFSRFWRLNIMPWDAFATTESTYLPQARNIIHNSFLDSDPLFEHLLMLDSDVLAVPWTIETLLSHKKGLVGGWYHGKGFYDVDGQKIYKPTVYRELVEVIDDVPYYKQYTYAEPKEEGLQKVAAIGAGCLLMHRDVAEDLGESPYHTDKGVGEDMIMSKKVTDLGHDIWVDWGLACAHVGVSYI